MITPSPDVATETAASAALRALDEDRWLSVQFAPDTARPALTALFLVYAEIERAPAMVKEPPVGEIRLQWWRDALAAAAAGEGPRGAPALDAARAARLFDRAPLAAFEPMIEARVRLLYEPCFETPAALADWMTATEGALARLAIRVADPGAVAPDEAVEAAAAAYGVVRRGPALLAHPDAPLDAIIAKAVAARPALRTLSDAARSAALYLALAAPYRRATAPSGLARRAALVMALLSGDLLRGLR